MEKAIIGGCDNLFVELSIPDEIKDNIEDVKAYIAGKREEFEAREAEMEKERFLIALEDFEAFNPHYDLEKPIKVKKGSILLVDGGFPHSQLTTMSDNGMTLFSSSTKEGYNDIWKICRANNVEIVDFRLIKNNKALKERFLKPGAVKFPIFYWFEDCEVLPMNLLVTPEGKEYKEVETLDIYGKPCVLRVDVEALKEIKPVLDEIVECAKQLIESLETQYAAKEIVKMCYDAFSKNGDNSGYTFGDLAETNVKKDVKEEYSIDNFLWEMTFPGYSIKHPFAMPTNFDAKSKTLSMGEIVALCYVIFDKPNSDRVSEILFSEKGIKHTYVDGREHFKPYENCKLPIYTQDEFVKEAMRFTDKNIIYVDGENTLSMKYIVGLCYKLFRKDVE